jgi:uric acid-xanthine permease
MGWKTHSQVVGLEGLSPIPGPECAVYNDEPLFYGATEYMGLGFSVLGFLIVIELFGSVFMKNCNVVIALLFGYMVAGLSEYNGAPYVVTQNIKDAVPFAFVWTETFPIGFYAPAVFPMLIAYLVLTVETLGDLTGMDMVCCWPHSPPHLCTSHHLSGIVLTLLLPTTSPP